MDKLTQLLEERWPFLNSDTGLIRTNKKMYRIMFTDGYNARIAEENAPASGNSEYDLKKVLDECRALITDGQSLKALRLYKETMGSSIMEAKAVLNL